MFYKEGREIFLKVWISFFLLAIDSSVAEAHCQILDPKALDLLPSFSPLKEPGRYCLQGNIEQKSVRKLISGQKIYSSDLPFIGFSTSEVTLDLAGFQILSPAVSRPVVRVLAPYRVANDSNLSQIRDRDFAFHSVKVMNGRINAPSEWHDAISIPRRILTVSLESDSIDRLRPRKYPLTDLTGKAFTADLKDIFERKGLKHWGNSVDNLEIIAGRTAVTMSGINNAVRDSKIIVTDSMAGAYMFGPGTVIENNIFIFRGIARTESAAPIKLHFGDKAVIRNNIFIIEEAELAPEQAISLIESRDVIITGNRVFGNAVLVRKYDDLTTTIERDNVILPLSDQPFVGGEIRAAAQVDLTRMAREESAPASNDTFDRTD